MAELARTSSPERVLTAVDVSSLHSGVHQIHLHRLPWYGDAVEAATSRWMRGLEDLVAGGVRLRKVTPCDPGPGPATGRSFGKLIETK